MTNIRKQLTEAQSLFSQRLTVNPLSLEFFALLLKGVAHMEKAMGLMPSGATLDAHTQGAMQELYGTALVHQDTFWWYTNWQIILKSLNMSIGSACFMGAPGRNGEVEIGYGINTPFQKQKFMTEALTALGHWALQQPGVISVTAETDADNPASHKVLRKAGFHQCRKAKGSLFWRRERDDVIAPKTV